MAELSTWPVVAVQADFVDGVRTLPVGNVWSDLGENRASSMSATIGAGYDIGTVETGTGTWVFDNQDEALTPENAASTFNTGGRSLKLYRRLRMFAGWPKTGNQISTANYLIWGYPLPGSSDFEGDSTGSWALGGSVPALITATTVRAHSGTWSMRVSLPTGAGGAAVTAVTLALPPTKQATAYVASLWVWVTSPAPALVLSVDTTVPVTATSSGSGSWQQVQVAFTATSGQHTLTLYPAAASTSGQLWDVDSVVLEYGTTATVAYASTGTVVAPIHSGYIEKYPSTWTHQGYQGWANVTTTDASTFLGSTILPEALTAETGAAGPVLHWPLTDPLYTRVAENIGTESTGPGLLRLPANAPSDTPYTFGYATGPTARWGETTTCARFSPVLDAGVPTDWSYLLGTMPGTTTVAGGSLFTVECWFYATVQTYSQMVLAVTDTGATPARGMSVMVQTDGTLTVSMSYDLPLFGGTDWTTTYGSVATGVLFNDSEWHHVAVVESASAGTVSGWVYVDGVNIYSPSRSAATCLPVWSVRVGANNMAPIGGGTQPHPLSGRVAQVAIHETALTSAQVLDHWVCGLTGFQGEALSARVSRVLAWSRWPGATSVDTSTLQVAPATGMAGVAAGDALRNLAATDNGMIFVQPNGTVRFQSRLTRAAQNVAKWTIQDTSAGVAYGGDVGIGRDITWLTNDVTVTGGWGSGATELDGGTSWPQRVVDEASITDYYQHSTSLTTLHDLNCDALALATFLLGSVSQPRTRITQLTLHPSVDPTMWPTVLAMAIGDRVTVVRHTQVGTTTLQGYVNSIAQTVSSVGPEWSVALVITPLSQPQTWILEDATYGVCGTTTIPTY